MNMTPAKPVLAHFIWAENRSYLRQVALVAFGVLLLAVCAKISVPMRPVPITLAVFDHGMIRGQFFELNIFDGSSLQEFERIHIEDGLEPKLIFH